MDLLRNIGITLAIAVFTAGAQTILKGISRTNLPGKKHGLTRDDSLFWSDWIIAACLALTSALIASAAAGKPIPLAQVLVSVGSLFLGCTALPFFLRLYAYDKNAKIKYWGWKGLGWILIANGAGMLVLLGSVYTGVSIYGF